MKGSPINIFALGGLGEVGKNTYCIENDRSLILVDAGVRFPEANLPGVDYVIPDYTYLKDNRAKIKGLFITHGHEDHIGGIPFLLRTVRIPVIYAPRLAAALIRHKLEDSRFRDPVKIVEYDSDSVIKIADDFVVSFFRVTHSIPDSFGLCIDTSEGRIIETGDFKIDLTPVGPNFEINKLSELGSQGVDLLMADSTNAEIEGYTPSETAVRHGVEEIFDKAVGRIIVSTFSSNINRIQQVVEVAVAHKRKICVLGRSMKNVIGIARELGYIKIPDQSIIQENQLKNYRNSEVCIVCTGSQGEPMAGLSRMADGSHRQVQIHAGDTVIISASPIPGNETSVGRTIDSLMRLGAHVVTSTTTRVHVSGHGSQEDLKTMLSLVKPKYFIPVHGEHRMLVSHAELAESLGVEKKNILIGENGTLFEFTSRGGKINPQRVQAGPVFVDGLGVGDVGNIVIRDRQQLAQDGVVIVVIALEKGSNQVLAGPDIVSRGFVYVRDSEALLTEARERIESVLDRCEAGNVSEWNAIKTQVRDALGKYFFDRTKRRPMILTIIQEVK